MPGKIFVRERRDVGEGEGKPRFAVVGAQGERIKFFKTHVRKSEIEAIAHAIGADVVYLPKGSNVHHRQPAPGGHGQGHGHKHRQAGEDASST